MLSGRNSLRAANPREVDPYVELRAIKSRNSLRAANPRESIRQNELTSQVAIA